MIRYFIILLFSLGLLSCNTAKKLDSSATPFQFESKCLRCDGSQQTIHCWGKGNSKKDALIQCRKNALRDVLFRGITLGNGNCRPQPLLPNANAEERNREFFNRFFSKDGDWQKFAILNEKRGCRKVAKNRETDNWQSEVTIDMESLETYLKQHNLK